MRSYTGLQQSKSKEVDSLHAIIDSKDSKVRELQKAVSNLKPVISHERDTAAEAVLT
jgi:hypothetical protein